MISEGSWDTEDWSNDAENVAFQNIFKQKRVILNSKDIYFLRFWSNKFSLKGAVHF